MVWFPFAISSALFESLKDVFGKKGLKDIDEYVISWSLFSFSLPLVMPILFLAGIPEIKPEFWLALLISGSLNTLAVVLYMKAIKQSDLSITIPILAFTPLFLLITSPLIVGEFPSAIGIIGVILIVVGSYLLKIKEITNGYLAPFRALFKETGPKLMLAVAFIWSITSNFDKIGVRNSSPIFWVAAFSIFMSLILFLLMLYKSKSISLTPSSLKILMPLGFFGGLTLIFQMIAISLTLVPYVISIKRTSAIISVVLGRLIFKEMGLKERLMGAAIMVLGAALIVLS